MQGRSPLRVADPEDRVASVMASTAGRCCATANHWSLCHDDALDAYQRALEIFLRADRVLPETEVAWLKVVIKHEALAIRRSRSESVSGEEPDLDARAGADPAHARRAGRRRRARAALRRGAARPQARRAPRADAQGAGLLLRRDRRPPRLDLHEGQPGDHRGPAAVHEGLPRDRVRRGLRALRADDRRARRRHRDQRGDRRDPPAPPALQRLPGDRPAAAPRPRGREVKLLLPGFLLAPVARARRSARDLAATALEIAGTPERSTAPAPGSRPPRAHPRSASAARRLYALLHRTQARDAAAGAYIATSGGGGRISTIATIIGFCVSGAGAGALCVATGVVQAPGWILGRPRPPARARREGQAEARPGGQLSAAARTTEVVATPTPVADVPGRPGRDGATARPPPGPEPGHEADLPRVPADLEGAAGLDRRSSAQSGAHRPVVRHQRPPPPPEGGEFPP